MSHKIRYRLLLLNARLLRNMLAIIGLAGFLSACSGGSKKENDVNQDSLNKVKEQHRLDSIAKAKDDSLAQVHADSLAKAREDSIAKAKAQQKPMPGHVITKYGVPVDYNEITPTKYGPPSDYQRN
ncbi:hypothetical protein DSECCO2_416070 [anaerobic digester metagenome]